MICSGLCSTRWRARYALCCVFLVVHTQWHASVCGWGARKEKHKPHRAIPCQVANAMCGVQCADATCCAKARQVRNSRCSSTTATATADSNNTTRPRSSAPEFPVSHTCAHTHNAGSSATHRCHNRSRRWSQNKFRSGSASAGQLDNLSSSTPHTHSRLTSQSTPLSETGHPHSSGASNHCTDSRFPSNCRSPTGIW